MSLDPDSLSDEQLERLRTVMLGREITIWLPVGTERRLRSWLHRINSDLQRAGHNEDLFDIDDDLPSALIAAAHDGLKADERDVGMDYDELTGHPK